MTDHDDEIDWRAMSAPDGGEFAAWMLSLLDEGPNRLAILEVPKSLPPGVDLDDFEAAFIRAYERAKADRPDLAVKLIPATADYPDAEGLVVLHEHRWV